MNGSQVTILGVVVVILVHEYKKSKAESEQVSLKSFDDFDIKKCISGQNNAHIWFQLEAESKMAREEIKERIFDLETHLEVNAEQIRNLVRCIVRCKKMSSRLEIT